MNAVGYEVNILLVLLAVDDMNKIILYTMDSNYSVNNSGNIKLANVSFEKKRKQFVSICLASYLFVSMGNRAKEVTVIADNHILSFKEECGYTICYF